MDLYGYSSNSLCNKRFIWQKRLWFNIWTTNTYSYNRSIDRTPLSGLIYDKFGSYNNAWILYIVIIVLMWFLVLSAYRSVKIWSHPIKGILNLEEHCFDDIIKILEK